MNTFHGSREVWISLFRKSFSYNKQHNRWDKKKKQKSIIKWVLTHENCSALLLTAWPLAPHALQSSYKPGCEKSLLPGAGGGRIFFLHHSKLLWHSIFPEASQSCWHLGQSSLILRGKPLPWEKNLSLSHKVIWPQSKKKKKGSSNLRVLHSQ